MSTTATIVYERRVPRNNVGRRRRDVARQAAAQHQDLHRLSGELGSVAAQLVRAVTETDSVPFAAGTQIPYRIHAAAAASIRAAGGINGARETVAEGQIINGVNGVNEVNGVDEKDASDGETEDAEFSIDMTAVVMGDAITKGE